MKREDKFRRLLGEGKALADRSSTTRLYAEDYDQIQSRCVNGRRESALIREAVHGWLVRERYKEVANDPALRELLRTFDKIVAHRQQPLRVEMHTMRRLIATTLMSSHCTMKLVEAFVGTRNVEEVMQLKSYLGTDTQLEPDGHTEGDQPLTLLDALFDQWEADAQRIISMLHEEMAANLAALQNKNGGGEEKAKREDK